MDNFPTLSVNPTYPLSPDGDQEDGVIRSPFESGYSQTRPRFTRSRARFGLTYNMPASDKTTLKAFEKTTLRNGADSFLWTHPIEGVTYTVQLTKPISYVHVSFGRYDVKIEMQEV